MLNFSPVEGNQFRPNECLLYYINIFTMITNKTNEERDIWIWSENMGLNAILFNTQLK